MLHQTGVFEEKCKVWYKKDEPLYTWATMKQEFGNAHRDMMINPTTATGAGYHNANAANNVAANNYCRGHAEALTNLVSATKSDQATVRGLVNANSSLAMQLALVTSKLADPLRKITLPRSNTPTQPNRQFQLSAP